jgi:hypothetical protein
MTKHTARPAAAPPLNSHPLSAEQIAAKLGTDRWIYLAVGPNVWGRGYAQDQALAAAGKPRHVIMFAAADPWAAINEMGDIVYTPREHPEGQPRPLEYVEVYRRTPRR